MNQKTKMNNIMIDNETMATTPDAVVLSIGGVKFDKNSDALGETFYAVLDIDQQVTRGRFVDPETVLWWSKQSPEAQEVVWTKDRRDVHDALSELWEFIYGGDGLSGGGNSFLWGNGSDFDNPQIASLFKMYGFDLPWEFWNNRCFRTIKSEFGKLAPAPKRTGTYHNALDDAITQAKHCQAIYVGINKMMGKK